MDPLLLFAALLECGLAWPVLHGLTYSQPAPQQGRDTLTWGLQASALLGVVWGSALGSRGHRGAGPTPLGPPTLFPHVTCPFLSASESTY